MDGAPRFLAVCLNPTLQKTLVLSSTRPGDVNRCLKSRLDASGKGVNVARVLGQLGETGIHLTHAGGRFRHIFLELAKQSGVAVKAVDSQSEIRFCTTVIELETDTATELAESSDRVGEATEARLLRAYNTLVRQHQVVIISGTKAVGYSESAIPDMVAAARKHACKIVLDIHGADLLNSLARGPTVAKPNFAEFIATFEPELTGAKASDPAAVARIESRMRQLSEEYDCAFVVTRGSRGTLVSEAGGMAHVQPEHKKVVNPIGSGDAFSAGLAAALAHGKSLEEAVAEGNRCGLLNALQLAPGTIRAHS